MAGIKQISGRRTSKPRSRKPTPIITNQDKWLLNALDEHLESENNPPRAGVFHPSQVGQTCDRLLYLGYNGLLESYKIVPKLARIFGCGSALEDRVAKYFMDMGILLDRELPVSCPTPDTRSASPVPFSGRIDFIIKHEKYGPIPVELKSINNAGFNKLIDLPKPEHLIQLQLYLHLFPPLSGWGTVLYENKDNQDLKAFLVKYDKQKIDAIFNRCKAIMAMETCPSKCGGERWCACKNIK
jgi:hypothetical protein